MLKHSYHHGVLVSSLGAKEHRQAEAGRAERLPSLVTDYKGDTSEKNWSTMGASFQVVAHAGKEIN